jgi:hypothetical protein
MVMLDIYQDKRPKCAMRVPGEDRCERPLAVKQARSNGNVACILQCPRGHWIPGDAGMLAHMIEIGWGPKR